MVKTKTRKNNASNIKKGTLDQKHTEKINHFEKINDMLPAKRLKLAKLEEELDNLISTNPNKYSDKDIRRKAYLMDITQSYRKEIDSIENCTESLNYIVNTLPILVNYYDNENLIDDGIEEEFVNDVNVSGKKNILSYFIQENNRINEQDIINKPKVTNKKRSSNNEKQFVGSKVNNDLSRAKLYDSYLDITDINHRKKSNTCSNICPIPECGGEKILSQNDCFMVCKKCGLSETILLSTDKPNYKEPAHDSGTYAYKRINHLTEILSQLQAKESTDIAPRVFQSILRELKRRKIDKFELDIFRLRRILKKLNYRKYYEHVPHILQIINGKEPPNFSRTDEARIKKMFRDIQKPFAIYCPKNRKNFLNYSYVLHKFCELLDLDEYINYFPLLKNNAKLLQHDRLWKNICKYMRWEYIKSL